MGENSTRTLDSGQPYSEQSRQSDAIRVARVLCILGVVYVHAWTGLGGAALELVKGTWQEELRWVLMETFGRSAVPLLGVISGWLMVSSSRTRDWRTHIPHKVRTIVVPMVCWNVIAIVLVGLAATWLHLRAPTPQSVRWVMEEVFILTHPPDINVQMPFLRDLFVCMVLAPWLVRLPTQVLTVLMVVAGLSQIMGYGPPILLRPSILMFFFIGIMAKRLDWATHVVEWPLLAVIAPFIVLMPLHLNLLIGDVDPFDGLLLAVGDLALRVAAAMAVWRLSWILAGSKAMPLFAKMEPYMFFYFCAHLTLLWLVGPMIGQFTGPLGSAVYPVYLVLQPVLVWMGVYGIASVLVLIAPKTARVLSGGRLMPQHPRSHARK